MNDKTKLSAEERQRLWDSAEADDTAGVTHPKQISADDKGAQTEGQGTGELPVTTEPAADDLSKRYAGIPQEFLDTMQGLQAQVAQLTGRVRGTEAHIGGIKSTLKQQLEAAKATRAAGADAPTDAQIKEAQAGGSAAMSALREKYPDFAGDLEAVLAEQRDAFMATQKQANEQPAQEQPQGDDLEARLAEVRRDAYIEAKHEGWKDLTQSPAFIGWFGRQDAATKQLGYDPDPKSGAKLIDAYKRQMSGGQHQVDPMERFAGAAALNATRNSGQHGTLDVNTMSKADYWRHLEEQDRNRN